MKIKTLPLVLLLSACTLTAPSVSWRAQRPLQYFEADGRLSVKAGEQGSYAHFDWLYENGVETIHINTPLGTSFGRLCRDAERVVAVDARGRSYHADTPERLSESLIGIPLPLGYLSAWANGEWANAAPYHISADGALVQSGWTVRRHVREDGSTRLLELQHQDIVVKMVFGTSRRVEGLPVNEGRCPAENFSPV